MQSFAYDAYRLRCLIGPVDLVIRLLLNRPLSYLQLFFHFYVPVRLVSLDVPVRKQIY